MLFRSFLHSAMIGIALLMAGDASSNRALAQANSLDCPEFSAGTSGATLTEPQIKAAEKALSDKLVTTTQQRYQARKIDTSSVGVCAVACAMRCIFPCMPGARGGGPTGAGCITCTDKCMDNCTATIAAGTPPQVPTRPSGTPPPTTR